MGCGGKCGGNKKTVQQNVGTEQKDPRAGARGFSDYAARAIICNACPFHKNGWRCSIADRPTADMRARQIDCPLKMFPDKENNVKIVGLSFNGVPMPLRQINEREAARQNKKREGKKPLKPASRILKGCGCVSSVKALADSWAKKGTAKRSVAAATEYLAPKLSTVVSYAIEYGLKAWRLPEQIGNFVWRKSRRSRAIEKKGKQVTSEQLQDIATLTREAIQTNANPKTAVDDYLAAHTADIEGVASAQLAALQDYQQAVAEEEITPLEIDPR